MEQGKFVKLDENQVKSKHIRGKNGFSITADHMPEFHQ